MTGVVVAHVGVDGGGERTKRIPVHSDLPVVHTAAHRVGSHARARTLIRLVSSAIWL
jgi:hypothetical protein